jgi:hypothetical protein
MANTCAQFDLGWSCRPPFSVGHFYLREWLMNKRICYNWYEGKKPENSRVVNRDTRWANPYTVEEYGREESLRLYRIWLKEKIKNNPGFLFPLIGKDLCCSCKLDEACHADILLDHVYYLKRRLTNTEPINSKKITHGIKRYR